MNWDGTWMRKWTQEWEAGWGASNIIFFFGLFGWFFLGNMLSQRSMVSILLHGGTIMEYITVLGWGAYLCVGIFLQGYVRKFINNASFFVVLTWPIIMICICANLSGMLIESIKHSRAKLSGYEKQLLDKQAELSEWKQQLEYIKNTEATVRQISETQTQCALIQEKIDEALNLRSSEHAEAQPHKQGSLERA
jgi:hypothetical protein